MRDDMHLDATSQGVHIRRIYHCMSFCAHLYTSSQYFQKAIHLKCSVGTEGIGRIRDNNMTLLGETGGLKVKGLKNPTNCTHHRRWH